MSAGEGGQPQTASNSQVRRTKPPREDLIFHDFKGRGQHEEGNRDWNGVLSQCEAIFQFATSRLPCTTVAYPYHSL